MKRIVFSSLLFFILTLTGYAQLELNLEQAIQTGIKNNYSVRLSQFDMEKSQKKVREILAIGLPQVNAEGNFNNFVNLPTTVIPANMFNPNAPSDELLGVKFGTDFSVTGSVTLTQLLFDGSYIVGLQATKNLAALSQMMVKRTENETKNEIIRAYYTAIVADENIKTLKATLDVVSKIANETKIISDNGLIESQDAEQLQLTVSTLKNALSRAEMMREASYLSLKMQMGLSLDTTITLTENMDAILASNDFNALKESALNLNQNLDHKMLETQITLNGLNMNNEKMKYYPSLGAFFTQQYQAFRNDFDFFADKPWYPATIWGLQLKVPVFSSGMRNARVEQAKVELEKSKVQLEQLDRALQLQTYISKAELTNAINSFNTQKEALALAESIQRKTMVKYKEGVVSSLELTMAQNQFLTAQANYIAAVFNLLSAKASLEKILNNTQK